LRWKKEVVAAPKLERDGRRGLSGSVKAAVEHCNNMPADQRSAMLLQSLFHSRVVLGCILLLSAGTAGAQNLLYVGNSRGDDVSVVDLTSLKVIGDIKVGERVHGVAVEPDGKRLFVSVESDCTLRIVDTTTRAMDTIKVSGRPNQVAVTPDGRYVVVPIRDGDRVDLVDAAKKEVVKSLPIKEPHNAVNAGSNRYVFVSSMGSGEINIIDYSAVIPAGGRPRPYVVSQDGRTMFVAVSELHGFDIVDIPEKHVIERVEMPAEHPIPHPLRYESSDTRTHGLALTPDGGELWVTSLLDDCVYIYEVKAKKFVGKVPTGGGPNWVAFTPDGKYVCVSNTDSDDVSVIDVKARKEVTRIKVGRVPKRLAIATAPPGNPQH
jgi:YVTN family beta-propeller protein